MMHINTSDNNITSNNAHDDGSQVRELIDFIQDDEKLRDERKKAKKNKDKYVGMSSNAMGGSGLRTSSGTGGGGGGGSTAYNDGWESSRRGADDRNWSKCLLCYLRKGIFLSVSPFF